MSLIVKMLTSVQGGVGVGLLLKDAQYSLADDFAMQLAFDGRATMISPVVVRKENRLEYPGSPIGIVMPDVVGQLCFDTINSMFYTATAKTSASWQPAGNGQVSARYKFFIPARQFLGSGTSALDLSGNGAHAVFGSSLTDALAWSASNFLTTAAGTNGYAAVSQALSSFNLAAESVLFHMRLLKGGPVASENIAGNAQVGSLHQGFYLSLRAAVAGGISKIRPIFRTSAGDFSSLADSTATFADRALTLAAVPAAGATAITLASSFSGPTGTYQFRFDNGDVRNLTLTTGSTAISSGAIPALTTACSTAVIVDANQTYHDIALAIDLVSASPYVKLYCDGILSDTYTTGLPTGTTTPDTGFAIGALVGLSGAGSTAMKSSGIHLLTWASSLPANIDRVVQKLSANPYVPLSDSDFFI